MPLLTGLRRSALTLPLASLAAVLVLAINEAAYHQATSALAGLGQRVLANDSIQTLWRGLIEAESGQRGYLLTGRAEYRKPYDNAVDGVQEDLLKLQRHFGADAEAAALVTGIEQRSKERLSEMATTLSLHEQGKNDAWQELLLTDIGREKMESLRILLDRLQAVESARMAAARQNLSFTLRISRFGVNAMTALSLLALVLFLRQTRAFDRAQRDHASALRGERDVLEAEVRLRTAELTDLAQHLQTAREDERHRLGRELHDELGALLTAAKLDAARLKRTLGTMAPDVQTRLGHLNDTINRGIELKRRIIEDLRPSSLSNLGLVAALEILTREFAQRSDLPVAADLHTVALADSAQITVYRLVQESLTNIAKYAAARSISVALHEDGGRAHISVRDDGQGFDARAARGSSHGLMGMRYRVEAEGGEMRVQSQPGQGSLIEAWLPLAPAAAEVTEAEAA